MKTAHRLTRARYSEILDYHNVDATQDQENGS
jgi:hypothetical protein